MDIQWSKALTYTLAKNKLPKKYSDLHIIKTQSLYTEADPFKKTQVYIENPIKANSFYLLQSRRLQCVIGDYPFEQKYTKVAIIFLIDGYFQISTPSFSWRE